MNLLPHEMFTTELSMRRWRTTEHENLVVGSIPLIYHLFDDQPALRLGNHPVDPLTTRRLVVRRFCGWRVSVPPRGYYFRADTGDTETAQRRLPVRTLSNSGHLI